MAVPSLGMRICHHSHAILHQCQGIFIIKCPQSHLLSPGQSHHHLEAQDGTEQALQALSAATLQAEDAPSPPELPEWHWRISHVPSLESVFAAGMSSWRGWRSGASPDGDGAGTGAQGAALATSWALIKMSWAGTLLRAGNDGSWQPGNAARRAQGRWGRDPGAASGAAFWGHGP